MTKKKNRKPIRYKTVRLKLTAKQKRSLDNFCRSRRTTPTKVIKRAIRPYIENFSGNIEPVNYVTENQLQLFELGE
jgi:hypothetical protein